MNVYEDTAGLCRPRLFSMRALVVAQEPNSLNIVVVTGSALQGIHVLVDFVSNQFLIFYVMEFLLP